MPKKLAHALIEAGMTHFNSGGIGGAISGLAGANNPYVANNPQITTQNFQPQIASAQGNQNEIYGKQNSLAGQLLDQSQGKGPNVAQAQLNSATAQNVATQGALQASQRGASTNPALIAREAARQGAQTQQQAAGQAATLGAQQQLTAQQQLSSLYGNQANQAIQQESIEQGGIAAQNSAITTGQLGASGLNAQVAGQNSGANAGLFGGLISGIGGGLGGGLGLYKGGVVPRKMASGGISSANTSYAVPAAYNVPDTMPKNRGGGGGDLSTALHFKDLSDLGKKAYTKFFNPSYQTDDQALEGYMDADAALGSSGIENQETLLPAAEGDAGNVAALGAGADASAGAEAASAGSEAAGAAEAGEAAEGAGGLAALLASRGGMIRRGGIKHYDDGGAVSDNVSIAKFGDGDSIPSSAQPKPEEKKGLLGEFLNKGGRIPFSEHLLNGGKVPGKAEVKGDSQKNDTQPTLLSPNEIVLPRSVTMAKDAPARAAKFVEQLLKKRDSKPGYGKVLEAKKSLKDRVDHLEKLCFGSQR